MGREEVELVQTIGMKYKQVLEEVARIASIPEDKAAAIIAHLSCPKHGTSVEQWGEILMAVAKHYED